MEVALTTTQSFGDQHNMVVGSLNHFTIEVKNPDYGTDHDEDKRFKHRARVATTASPLTIGAATTGDLIAGVEYTIVAVADADKNKDWSVIGHIDASESYMRDGNTFYNRTVEPGQKFVAAGYNTDGTPIQANEVVSTAFLADSGNTVAYGSEETILKLIVPALQNIMSVVAIGKVNVANGKVNIAVENSGKAEFPQPLDATGTGTYPGMYPGVSKERILEILNRAYGIRDATGKIDPDATTHFDVDYFDF